MRNSSALLRPLSIPHFVRSNEGPDEALQWWGKAHAATSHCLLPAGTLHLAFL
jgi:hypothetical protein